MDTDGQSEDQVTRLTNTTMLYDGMRETLNALRSELLHHAKHRGTERGREQARTRSVEVLAELHRVDPYDRAQIIAQRERWLSELVRLNR